MADQWQWSHWVGTSLRWDHRTVNLGTVYHQVAAVNLFPLQNSMPHGEIQWAPAHPHLPLSSHHLQRKSLQFVCQTPSSMQVKFWPQPYLQPMICWTCSITTKDGDRKISWSRCSLMVWQRYSATADSDGTAMKMVAMVGWRKSRNSIPQEILAVATLRKPGKWWSARIAWHCVWDPSF